MVGIDPDVENRMLMRASLGAPQARETHAFRPAEVAADAERCAFSVRTPAHTDQRR